MLRFAHKDFAASTLKHVMASRSSSTLLSFSHLNQFSTSSTLNYTEKNQKAQQPKSFLSKLFFGGKNSKDEKFKKLIYSRNVCLHELIVHKVKPGYLDEYVKQIPEIYSIYEKKYGAIVKPTGCFTTLIGSLDSVVHILEYPDYPSIEKLIEAKQTDPDLTTKLNTLLKLTYFTENQLMQEMSFCPTSPPTVTNGVYEFRSYTLKPGSYIQWLEKWQAGLQFRSNLPRLKGAWYSKNGTLNQVHHIWAYESMAERRKFRRADWDSKGWSDSVRFTMPLIDVMHSCILKPLPFSPLR
ncbi:hypothetical protein BB560_005454 [Smittium megazygosporum]|uniref:NIPSNAP domain-containing protein n=1 Tax=Smittium megazygosporum TaxID=133381 RepID=A0A2T9Z5A5_9FUNG|nr:hypothetical protein BB560_005454 [Smittium megazygosporum]